MAADSGQARTPAQGAVAAPAETLRGGASPERSGSVDAAGPSAPINSQPQSNTPRAARTAWYALPVASGHEAAAVRRVRRLCPAAVAAVCPQAELARRAAGTWTLATQPLFPGYVLVESADSEALARELAALARPLRLVEVGGRPAALAPEEAELLFSLMDAEGVVRLSVGDIVAGELHVARGPLAGREDLVRLIDRHARAAWLSPEALPLCARLGAQGELRAAGAARRRGPQVGLEVVSKS